MKKASLRSRVRSTALGFFTVLLTAGAALGQSTTFTYQGKLNDSGSAANGSYDFQFKLFNTGTVGTGTQFGSMVPVSNVTVTNGIFTVQLDFSPCANCFDGSARFLEIAVKPTSGSTFNTLGPRQPITSNPYTIRSLNATSADGLSVACVNCVSSTQIQSVEGSQINGAIPVASVPGGSVNYIQNGTTLQASSNFNISGNGTAGGTLSGNAVNTATQYNFGGQRVLAITGSVDFPDSNAFVGVFSGASNTPSGSFGIRNSFFGYEAGYANSSGYNNSFFGHDAGLANRDGASNSFFGTSAGRANGDGFANSFFGAGAGANNTTAVGNSFFGASAGVSNSTGGFNSFFGKDAGIFNNGDGNSFFGRMAGDTNTTGSNNTIIGIDADVGSNNLTNATAIGARALVSESNSLVLGSINGVNSADQDTKVGIGITAPNYPLTVLGTTGSGQNQGVAEFRSAGTVPDTGIRINNTAASGHIWTLFSSGAGSGLGAGNFTIFDATSNSAKLTIDQTGNIFIPGTSSQFFGNTTRQMLNLWGTVYGVGVQNNTFYSRSDGGFAWFNKGIHSNNPNDAGTGGTVLMKLNSSGNLDITGNLSKGGGSFKIDHPLDPENKYLYHSFVESPDMKNVYDGNITTDSRGLAIVQLPAYFEALNRDFRYQLTVLGQFAQAFVLREIENNRFVIKTSKPRVKVSWQVTGIRQDAYANQYRIQVEQEKALEERGTYLHPEAFMAARISSARKNPISRNVRR